MGQALHQPFYNTPRLIVGGDMNHYPGPQGVDFAVQQAAGLDRLPLAEPTWLIEGSRHEWIAKIGSLVTGRSLASFDAELDAMLYRGLELVSASAMTVESDHKAIVAEFC